MGKSMSVYLGDTALVTLDNIRNYFRQTAKIEAADSAIIAAAINVYAWFLTVSKDPNKHCPNAACGNILNGCVDTCPACSTPIKWVAILP